MKNTTLALLCALCLLHLPTTRAQNDSTPLFNTLRFEVRADFMYHHLMTSGTNLPLSHDDNTYGFKGQYFNIHVGGNLTPKLSYYFRQRMVANPGSNSFFDNTDFLYLNYAINKNWSLRVGKEALAVGGFEYDAPPIDVLYWSYYWDNFYCFQLAASAKYTTNDGKNSFVLQVGNSPYIHYDSPFQNSLLSYNLFWSGNFGHFQTLYSFNMFQRDKKGRFMNYVALGHKLVFDKWDLYVDFIHRATSTKELFKNFGVVTCANIYFGKQFNLFIKGAYEQNHDLREYNYYTLTGESWDCLSVPGLTYFYGGLGFELRPRKCPDIRIHGFIADIFNKTAIPSTSPDPWEGPSVLHQDIYANVGVTWNIDLLKYINKKLK